LSEQSATKPEGNRRHRRCIVSRESSPTEGLIRFVVGPENEIVPDIHERLPGRGIWITAEKSAIETAIAKNMFARAAKQKVNVDPAMIAQIEMMLVKSCLNLLGLAQRSGEVRQGFEKVRSFLKSGEAAILIAAADGAADGRTKLLKLAQNVREDVHLVENFSSSELSLALGHENVVHAAVKSGGLAERIKRESTRLRGMRAMP
jgi:predicted RNA-binding protein YlxR (DUF448 family)